MVIKFIPHLLRIFWKNMAVVMLVVRFIKMEFRILSLFMELTRDE